MEVEMMEDGYEEAASPSAQFLNSSVLSLTILGVIEFEIPIQATDSLVLSLLKDVFVPINPRFSSIMVCSNVPSLSFFLSLAS